MANREPMYHDGNGNSVPAKDVKPYLDMKAEEYRQAQVAKEAALDEEARARIKGLEAFPGEFQLVEDEARLRAAREKLEEK